MIKYQWQRSDPNNGSGYLVPADPDLCGYLCPPSGWGFYASEEADEKQRIANAEIARLKAASRSHFDQAMANGVEISRLNAEADEISRQCVAEVKAKADAWIEIAQLKAALRWALENAACSDENGVYSAKCDVLNNLEIPPEFATLIAEAVESGKQEEKAK